MREYGLKLGFLVVLIGALIIFPIYLFFKGDTYDYAIQNDKIELVFNEDGSITVEEEIKVRPHSMISSIEKDFFPVSARENKKYNCYDCVRNIKVYVDGVESAVEKFSKESMDTNARKISFDPTTRDFMMKLSYSIDQRAVSRYTDFAAFGFNVRPIDSNIKKLNITITVPESGSERFYLRDNTTGSNMQTKRLNETTYRVSQDDLYPSTQTNLIIVTDTNALNASQIMMQSPDPQIFAFDYDAQTRARLEFIAKNQNNLPLVYFIIFSTVIYFFLKVIRYKRNGVKKVKEDLIVPYSQTDIKVLPPLASKMISGKSKDFALSLILTLQERGNIGIKADGTLIYLNDNHLSSYEYQFLKVLFEKDKLVFQDAVSIPQFAQKVNKNLDTKTCFKQDFGVVRDLATEALYQNRIYDKNLGNFMNAFEKYGFVNMIAAVFLIIGYLSSWIQPEVESIEGMILTIFAISVVFLFLPIDLHVIWKYVDHRIKKVLRFAYLLLLAIVLVPVIGYVMSTKELYLLLVLIFAFVQFLLFRFYDEELLTKYGRMEYLRLSGLRHFCRHYYDYEAQTFETHPYFKYYLKYIVAFGDMDTILPNQNGVLKVLDRQLKELFPEES